MTRSVTSSAHLTYRIGAVARITGLSTHTLRKWEDRHGLIAPRRSEGGERIYSAADVQRLSLARDLARAGMPLGDLAGCETAELERLLQETRGGDAPDSRDSSAWRLGLAVLGTALPPQLQGSSPRLRRLRLLASAAELDDLREALAGTSPDLLIVECPAITDGTAEELARAMETVDAAAALVVYGFGTHAHVDALRRPEVSLVRAPVDAVELERHCLGLASSLWDRWPQAAPVSAAQTRRRYSREALARIAGMSTDIACECPRHLADLIMSLEAFEDYSASCVNRNDRDAALHRHLQETAIAGRALLEEALSRVVAHEDISLTAGP